jgi:2'-5' RNA ligase
MDTITFEPFDLIIEHLGRFKRRSGDTWWVGVSESRALMDLQQELTSGLLATGFELDKRKYSPHITLGREIVTSYTPRSIESFGEVVTKFDLMKSEHIDGKLTYTAIHVKEA